MDDKPSSLLFNGLPTLDVRSPGEYEKGCVPGAISFPLFTDDERARVGIIYKRKGQEEAIELGMSFVEPKLIDFETKAKQLLPEGKANMYCWRGGMRSGSMADFLRSKGLSINVLPGGYKAWRNEVMETLALPYKFINLGGYTGVGKTDILVALKKAGAQTVDLEGLALHTGSAFNSYEERQPSTEQFENLLAEHLLGLDANIPIWIEDESKAIGKVFLNHDLFERKQQAPFILLHRPKEERIASLCQLYGDVASAELKHSFTKIERRVGGQYVQAAHAFIDEGDLASAAAIALRYYDKAYERSMSKQKRHAETSLDLANTTAEDAAKQLIQWSKARKHLFD